MLSSWFGLEPIPICSIDLAEIAPQHRDLFRGLWSEAWYRVGGRHQRPRARGRHRTRPGLARPRQCEHNPAL